MAFTGGDAAVAGDGVCPQGNCHTPTADKAQAHAIAAVPRLSDTLIISQSDPERRFLHCLSAMSCNDYKKIKLHQPYGAAFAIVQADLT